MTSYLNANLPVTDLVREDAWAIARRLGFAVPGDAVVSITLTPSEVVVVTADLDEQGHKFVVVNPITGERDISTTEHAFRYADVQREFDEADARRAERDR